MLREHPTGFAPARLRGLLHGLAIGDALGRPADGLSHQNVRLYFKGIKEYRDDEHRAGTAGTGSALTAVALGAPSGEPLSPYQRVICAAPDALAGAPPSQEPVAQAYRWSLTHLAGQSPEAFSGARFWEALCTHAPAPLRASLQALSSDLDAFPLDLADACGGTDTPEAAWRFATAMFARNPLLVEATLLSAINVGGQTAFVGAVVGSLLGVLHGAEAFPNEWHDGLAARADVLRVASALSAGSPPLRPGHAPS